MTTETTPATPPPPAPVAWPVLDLYERRVLGVLSEKQKTTPNNYPLTLNALVSGCNQSSNREPVLTLEDTAVEDVLGRLQKKGLVNRVTGSRADRWRHLMYDAWKVTSAEMAVLTELLLRCPQTEGELRSRVSRMEAVEDVDALRALLKPLAERRLVVYLTPQGKRGTTLTHGFHDPQELERLRSAQPVEAPSTPAVAPVPAAAPTPAAPAEPAASREELAALEARLDSALAEMATLRTTVTELQATVAALAEQVRQLKEGLGV
jgi:uncharacterized protein YceH (UPF0502 family)